MWIGGLFIWIQKQIVVVRVACSCVLERSKILQIGYGSVAADAKCWQSAWRKCSYAQIFHASRSFPFLCGAACFLPCCLASLRRQPSSAASMPALLRCAARPVRGVSPPALRRLRSSGLPSPSACFPSAPCPRAFPLPLRSKLAGGNAVFPLCLLTCFFIFFPSVSFFFFSPFFVFYPGPMVWLSLISGE